MWSVIFSGWYRATVSALVNLQTGQIKRSKEIKLLISSIYIWVVWPDCF